MDDFLLLLIFVVVIALFCSLLNDDNPKNVLITGGRPFPPGTDEYGNDLTAEEMIEADNKAYIKSEADRKLRESNMGCVIL